MINAAVYTDVEKVFVNLVRDKDAWASQQERYLTGCFNDLRMLQAEQRSMKESEEIQWSIYEEIKVVRKRVQDGLRMLNEASRLPEFSSLETEVARLKADFQTICQLPYIIDASADQAKNEVSFVIHATCNHQGERYFIGDWKVTFGDILSDEVFELRCVNSGLTVDWKPLEYPDYTLRDGSFCVGSNGSALDSLFAGRQYVQAILLLKSVLFHINETDELYIPRAFVLERSIL